LLTVVGAVLAGLAAAMFVWANTAQRFSDQEFEVLGEDISSSESPLVTYEQRYANWQRPPGPLRVGLQVGHWNNDEFPEELARLRNNGGASGGGKAEWQVNLAIAQATAQLIAERNSDVIVDILPATVPPMYLADIFVAIHADGSPDPGVAGFKVAAPSARRDLTRQGALLETIFKQHYAQATGMPQDANITRNMRGYYAFNWRRYEHSTHPMTPAIIVETGFLTSQSDQRILVRNPQLAAQGIANSVFDFLGIEPKPLLAQPNLSTDAMQDEIL